MEEVGKEKNAILDGKARVNNQFSLLLKVTNKMETKAFDKMFYAMSRGTNAVAGKCLS